MSKPEHTHKNINTKTDSKISKSNSEEHEQVNFGRGVASILQGTKINPNLLTHADVMQLQ